MGEVSRSQGNYDQAFSCYDQALVRVREIGDPWAEAETLNGLSEALLATGQPGQAHDLHTNALTLTRRTGDRYQQARAHRGLAEACLASGQPEQAHEHWQQAALDIYTDLGVPEAEHMRTHGLGGLSPISVTPERA